VGRADRRVELRLAFEEFKTVSPGIFGVKAAGAGNRSVVGDFDPVCEERLAQFVEVGGDEGGVSFLGGTKIGFDADVELLGGAFEPATAARAERLGLFDFGHAEQGAVECSGGGFAAGGSGDLEMVEVGDSNGHVL
jgi:hypothetical protein